MSSCWDGISPLDNAFRLWFRRGLGRGRVVEGGEFALMGTTMAPGFAQSDYEGGTAEELGDL